ncbi:hypothetical protein H4S06_001409 [Coemansia sp. BCRC 34490]|nr:hypothetical protein H4S06_001409 [Coemansia sp. BCRC 34490]
MATQSAFSDRGQGRQHEAEELIARSAEDMEALFSGFFGSIEALRQDTEREESQDVDTTIAGVSSGLWTPRIERQETDEQIVLVARLPYVPRNQVRIDTDTPGRIKISGECSSSTVYQAGVDRVTERQLGQFEKDLPLPPAACVERMTAIFHGFDVVITIPKY